MKLSVVAFVAVCAILEVRGYPYPYYGANVDSYSFGSGDRNRGAMVLSRYYSPYYNPRAVGAGMAAFMFRPQEYQQQSSQYYVPDRRRQTPQDFNVPPQQNEVFYQTPELPSGPEQTYVPEQPQYIPAEQPTVTEATEIADPTEKIETPTTVKAVAVPEITEPEVEEVPEPAPKKRVTKKKQVKRPVDEEEDEVDEYPRIPMGAYFPMFFGYGGRSGQGTPQGATAIANAFSTGRGGVATSHATAYGPPRPDQVKL